MEECGFAHDCGGLCFPRREPPRRRLHTRRVLRHHEPPVADPCGELCVRGWVVAIDAAPKHRDGPTVGIERAAVRLSVDSSREAAEDDKPRGRELPSQQLRDLRSIRGARPRAHYRHGRSAQELDRGATAKEEPGRRVVKLAQARWIGAFLPAHEPQATRRKLRSARRLVEAAPEPLEPPLTRHFHEVCPGLGRKHGEREIAHGRVSSVGER
jgi:hypothetical protein